MDEFARRTGLTSDRPCQRYLWTDAFAVCNFLGLSRVTGDGLFGDLAEQLINQVHHTLGRHRLDDTRFGWLSGLSEREGAAHPTRGGLRIGKSLPERGTSDPANDRLEWDRDGQYFHYLTKWMHALDQAARATQKPRFSLWARELAQVAWAEFSRTAGVGARRRLAWKMSIDLTRPLVPSMGQHDALDGFVAYSLLEETASRLPPRQGPALDKELAGLASLASGTDWVTTDLLGIGGLLIDAAGVAQLASRSLPSSDRLLRALLFAAAGGLARSGVEELDGPAPRRLAFRELGLSIGLHALRSIKRRVQTEPGLFSHRVEVALAALVAFEPLGAELEAFWLDPRQRDSATWRAHRDINEVMLATSLVPEGFLERAPLGVADAGHAALSA